MCAFGVFSEGAPWREHIMALKVHEAGFIARRFKALGLTVVGAHDGVVRRLNAAFAQRRGAVRALVCKAAPRAAIPPQHQLLA